MDCFPLFSIHLSLSDSFGLFPMHPFCLLVNNQPHIVFLSLFFFFGACSWSQGKWGDKESEGLIAILGTMASWKAFQFKPIS